MATQYVTVASGTGVSSAFTISGAGPVGLFVASHAARNWSLGFATTSAGVFHPLAKPDGGGTGCFLVASTALGPGVGVLLHPPSGICRVEVRNVATWVVDSTLSVVSCQITDLAPY